MWQYRLGEVSPSVPVNKVAQDLSGIARKSGNCLGMEPEVVVC
jgi:hypothetical protein